MANIYLDGNSRPDPNYPNSTIGLVARTVADEKQTIAITDMISEGPIYGLVNGVNSVYLNNEPQSENPYVARQFRTGPSTITLRNGQSTADVLLVGDEVTINESLEILDANRLLCVRDNIPDSPATIKNYQYYESGGFSGDIMRGPPRFIAYENVFVVAVGSDTSWYLNKDYITTNLDKPFDSDTVTNYVPVRIRNASQGNTEIEGVFYGFPNSTRPDINPNPQNGLKFSPRVFDGENSTTVLVSDTIINSTDTYEVYVDRIIALNKNARDNRSRPIAAIGDITDNNDGSKSFTIQITEEWNHNYQVSYNSGNVNLGNETITLTGHKFETGDKIGFRGNPGNLSVNVEYYAIKVDANTIKVAETFEDAVAGTAKNLTSAGSGTRYVEKIEYRFDDFGYDTSNASNPEVAAIIGKKAVGTTVQFRTGTKTQTPLVGFGGYGSTVISTSSNQSLSQTNERDFGGDQAPVTLLATAGTGFNLSGAQVATVDEISVRVNYPGGLNRAKGTDVLETYIIYAYELFIKRPGEAEFEKVSDRSVRDTGASRNAVNTEAYYDMTKYRPFEDFKVVIHRKSPDDGDGISGTGGLTTQADTVNISKANVSGTSSIFKEKLNHPFTALGKVSFISGNFEGTPSRGYQCRGLLVKVPSNYVTREEAIDGKAKYTRNSDGLVTNTYQDWDGTFRSDKVYTNNPAWVFYDMITNNRYGLGDFIAETDIDKYSLYRIARYCDEEVDDGKGLGTTEPRYTMNVYLTKSIDAYKVLKDMASNFVTMLYYLNGQLFPSQDSPAGPVYAFSKANVLDGSFSYESSGSKTRSNQVIVNWNNPEANYEIEPLIVEDVRNIAETGNLITQEVTAFGCTSQGQATRYGKWKLWTATNQQEVVSFSTGINGSFITPGDVILVQDADRHTTRLSGRISNTGTRNTKTVPIDSGITIDTNNTYELSIIFQGDAAFLAEDSVDISFTDATCDITGSSTTINCDSTAFMKVGQSVTHASRIPAGTTITKINSATQFTISQATTAGSGLINTTCTFTTSYTKADRVTEAYIDDDDNGTYTYQAISSSTYASNAKASASATDALVLTWKDDFRVETQEVDKTATGTGADKTSLVMNAPFSSTPNAGEIWVVTEKNADSVALEGSGKEYRVLSIAQNSKNEYEISAVEHYNEKFDSIEKDLNTYIPSLVDRTVVADTVVPPPNDVWLNIVTVRGRSQENLEVRWDARVQRKENLVVDSPVEVETLVEDADSSLVNVEIHHNIPNLYTPIVVGSNQGLHTFPDVGEGTYTIAVRTVNTLGNRSVPVVRVAEVTGRTKDRTKNTLPDAFHAAGTISRGMEIS